MPARFEWNQGVADRLSKNVNDAAGRSWRRVNDEGTRRAPVLTGRLRGSTTVVEDRTGLFRIQYQVPYAWRQHQRHGWMRPELIDASRVEREIAAATKED